MDVPLYGLILWIFNLVVSYANVPTCHPFCLASLGGKQEMRGKDAWERWSGTEDPPPNGKSAFVKFCRISVPTQLCDVKRGGRSHSGEGAPVVCEETHKALQMPTVPTVWSSVAHALFNGLVLSGV